MRRIVIIAGPSGGGKTTVAEALCQSGEYIEARSATARAPRADGRDSEYIYLSRDEFLLAAANGEMLEYTEYAGNLYGTYRRELDRIFSLGKTPILVLDFCGVRALKSASVDFEVLAFYIYHDMKTVEKRLFERGGASSAEFIAARMAVNKSDYLDMPSRVEYFDALVKNESIDQCRGEIETLIDALASDKKTRAALLDKNKKIAMAIAQDGQNYS